MSNAKQERGEGATPPRAPAPCQCGSSVFRFDGDAVVCGHCGKVTIPVNTLQPGDVIRLSPVPARKAAEQDLADISYALDLTDRKTVAHDNARAALASLRAILAASPAQEATPPRETEPTKMGVRVCGVDCHPGDDHCNNYCRNPEVKQPPSMLLVMKRGEVETWVPAKEEDETCPACGMDPLDRRGEGEVCLVCAAPTPEASAPEPTRESEQKVGKYRGDSAEAWGNGQENPTTRDPDRLIAFIQREREGYAATIADLRATVAALTAERTRLQQQLKDQG
jgi:uncharacterized Zn finger protein (UPF0148 family)